MIVSPTDDHSIVQHINMCRRVIRRLRERGGERERQCVSELSSTHIVKLLYAHVLEFDHITTGDRNL